MSFEHGSMLTYQLRARTRACAHWRQHLSRFPAGRYTQEVGRAMAYLHCFEQP